MKKAAIAAIAMIFGAVIGGGAAYAYATYEYEKRMVKELDSYKRALDALDMTDEKDESDDTVEPDAKTDISEEPPVKKDPNDYEEIIQNYDREIAIAVEDQPVDYTEYAIKQSKDYIKHAIADPIEDSENDHDPAKPYVITDEEYYDDDEYTKIELFLFDDYLLTDEFWDPLEEPEKVVPMADLKKFIEDKDEDELFTRSDSRRCLYNICKQDETWDDFVRRHPIILEKG